MPGPTIDLTLYADEAALLVGLRSQHPDACTCLVKRFTPLVYARALRLTSDPDEAEGVLQTSFIKACTALPTFEGTSSLSTWLYRITTNEGLMLLRQRRPQVSLDELRQPADLSQQPQAWAADPLDAALNAELQAHFAQAISALPAPLRNVLLLRGREGLSTEETASQLGISPGAVKVRLHRARQRLREALRAYLLSPTEADQD